MEVKKIDKPDLRKDFVSYHCSECHSTKGLTKIVIANNVTVLCEGCKKQLTRLLESDSNNSLLKQLRMSKGLTQQELAKKLNMSVQNLRGYENGNYISMNSDIENKIKSILGEKYKYTREG